MGKFEDLVQQARDGDMDALTTLETEFGGSNLREQVDAANQSLKDNDQFIRTGKFQSLKAEMGDDVDLSLEDFEGVDSNDFSADLLREKAEEKSEAKVTAHLAAATAAGFESVEEYDQALEALKSAQSKKKDGMETLGGATASTSGGQTPPVEEKEPYDAALDDFQSATKGGATHDVALGEAAHTLMANQHPELEESK